MNKSVDATNELMKTLIDPDNQVKAGQLTIIGGEFTVNLLDNFMNQWPLHEMPYRIWDSFDQVKFEKGTLPDSRLLERGRIFGGAGDLDIRRDGNRFLWRFVGELKPDIQNGFNFHYFWDEQPEIKYLHCSEEKAMLWGKYEAEVGRWYDNRVGSARLKYPLDNDSERVVLVFKQYSYAGQVQFIQFMDIRGWENGKQRTR
jgi:hypothetical protein